MMRTTRLGFILVISMIGVLPASGCSVSEYTSERSEDLWIWGYVDKPHAEGDAADAFLEFLAFAREGCGRDKWRTGIELLTKVATSQDSSIEVVIVREWVTGQNLYQWTFAGRELEGEIAIPAGECISGLVSECKDECDAQEMSELAGTLLLVGYQLSRNGEDPAMAIFRNGIWRLAVDLLLQSQEEPRSELFELAECLEDTFYLIEEWEDVEVRYPGWEQCLER